MNGCCYSFHPYRNQALSKYDHCDLPVISTPLRRILLLKPRFTRSTVKLFYKRGAAMALYVLYTVSIATQDFPILVKQSLKDAHCTAS